MNIYELDHIKVAKHFGVTVETLRIAKNKHKEGKLNKFGRTSIWHIYAKAYAFDMLMEEVETKGIKQ